MEKSDDKTIIQNIFKDIDNAIEKTRSDVPVKIKDSKLLKKYIEIKEKYLKEIN